MHKMIIASKSSQRHLCEPLGSINEKQNRMANLFSKQYKLATTLWILSCNDTVPQMTIQGILNRTTDFTKEEIESAINKHPELFQRHIPKKQLNNWKELMKKGTKRPKWIAANKDKNEVIDKLTVDDLFRNRFRTSIESPPVKVDKLQWGLNHLSHIYSLEIKQKESTNQWWKFILLPLLSILLTALTITLNYVNQQKNFEFEKEKYEKNTIQPIYADFMEALNKAQFAIIDNDKKITAAEIAKLNNLVAQLYPYFEEEKVKELNDKVNDYGFSLFSVIKNNYADTLLLEKIANQYVDLRTEMTDLVKDELK